MQWANLIATLGFPIVCAIVMAIFIFRIYRDTCDDREHNRKLNDESMKRVQAQCQAREEKLYNEIAECRKINSKAIETIAHYAEKLDRIQEDIRDIKTDLTVIMSRE